MAVYAGHAVFEHKRASSNQKQTAESQPPNSRDALQGILTDDNPEETKHNIIQTI